MPLLLKQIKRVIYSKHISIYQVQTVFTFVEKTLDSVMRSSLKFHLRYGEIKKTTAGSRVQLAISTLTYAKIPYFILFIIIDVA